ncbi:MAG: hypothetical protein OQJ96_12805 [Flavobacteriales bacterium]|nr:hypothetical protein [Flavobacteriales bacterium]MCW8912867.1 hypothetical protein [Flavobacteriales bacterium]MCW8937216.1 hypothetical protein [Flavobacteriales bacterium]MCW8939393.1 hypothetical protein [Flavobacteriales bacterium]MCW8967823.1 hypothetical protein [Flavobacteriales bacterium]
MKGHKIIAVFFLLVLVSTFSFSYFSVPTYQFVEIAEEENRHSGGSTVTFSMQEYITEDLDFRCFFHAIDLKHQVEFSTLFPPSKEIVAPPPELA